MHCCLLQIFNTFLQLESVLLIHELEINLVTSFHLELKIYARLAEAVLVPLLNVFFHFIDRVILGPAAPDKGMLTGGFFGGME